MKRYERTLLQRARFAGWYRCCCVGDERKRSRGLYMLDHRHQPGIARGSERNDEALSTVREQLKAYFAGKLQEFELALAGEGSDFQTQSVASAAARSLSARPRATAGSPSASATPMHRAPSG